MINTVSRRKIEILVDKPLVRLIAEAAEQAGIGGYTLLRTEGGSGHGGPWHDDQVTGAAAKVMFVTVTSEPKAAALIDKLAPLLDSHSLILATSVVDVVRGEKF